MKLCKRFIAFMSAFVMCMTVISYTDTGINKVSAETTTTDTPEEARSRIYFRFLDENGKLISNFQAHWSVNGSDRVTTYGVGWSHSFTTPKGEFIQFNCSSELKNLFGEFPDGSYTFKNIYTETYDMITSLPKTISFSVKDNVVKLYTNDSRCWLEGDNTIVIARPHIEEESFTTYTGSSYYSYPVKTFSDSEYENLKIYDMLVTPTAKKNYVFFMDNSLYVSQSLNEYTQFNVGIMTKDGTMKKFHITAIPPAPTTTYTTKTTTTTRTTETTMTTTRPTTETTRTTETYTTRPTSTDTQPTTQTTSETTRTTITTTWTTTTTTTETTSRSTDTQTTSKQTTTTTDTTAPVVSGTGYENWTKFTDTIVSIDDNKVTFAERGRTAVVNNGSNMEMIKKAGAGSKVSIEAIVSPSGSILNIIDIEVLEKPALPAGDANGDGKLNLSDAVLIMQSLANPEEFTIDKDLISVADVVDKGNGITSMDALAIQLINIDLLSAEDLPITSEELNKIIG